MANRPLSPHLQVYRLPLTGLISISHRMTGVLLVFATALILWLLVAIAVGESAYQLWQTVMTSWPGRVVYWGIIYALMFHLCHGIRHLLWDFGKTLDKAMLTGYAVAELLLSAALTLAVYFLP